MKSIVFLSFFIFILISCQPSAIKQSFSSADSLVIHFKNEKEGIVTKTIQTAELNAINRIIDFIDRKKYENERCVFNGKMFFYSAGQKIQEVDFNMKDNDCTYFVFELEGKLVSTKMNQETIDFFDALEKGLPFY